MKEKIWKNKLFPLLSKTDRYGGGGGGGGVEEGGESQQDALFALKVQQQLQPYHSHDPR